jgi:hypothetical protein
VGFCNEKRRNILGGMKLEKERDERMEKEIDRERYMDGWK